MQLPDRSKGRSNDTTSHPKRSSRRHRLREPQDCEDTIMTKLSPGIALGAALLFGLGAGVGVHVETTGISAESARWTVELGAPFFVLFVTAVAGVITLRFVVSTVEEVREQISTWTREHERYSSLVVGAVAAAIANALPGAFIGDASQRFAVTFLATVVGAGTSELMKKHPKAGLTVYVALSLSVPVTFWFAHSAEERGRWIRARTLGDWTALAAVAVAAVLLPALLRAIEQRRVQRRGPGPIRGDGGRV
jgi:hypothetical protein